MLQTPEERCDHVEHGLPFVSESHIGSEGHEKQLILRFCGAGVGREGGDDDVCETGEVMEVRHLTVAGWRVHTRLFGDKLVGPIMLTGDPNYPRGILAGHELPLQLAHVDHGRITDNLL